MKRTMLALLIGWILIALTSTASEGETREPQSRTISLDAGVFYYGFSDGADLYGPWWGSHLRILNGPPRGLPGLTGIFEAAVEKHDDPTGSSGGFYTSGSGYYDWSEQIYSFSSIGAGTAYPFVRFNVHHELDFKIPPQRTLVVAGGAGYVDYHGIEDSPYFMLGGTYYWRGVFSDSPQVILQYRLRRYFPSEASEQLNAHIIVTEFRWQDGRSALLRYVRGREAYATAGGAGTVLELDQGGEAFTVEYRQSLNDRLGLSVGFNFIHKFHTEVPETIFSAPGGEFGILWNL